MQTLEQRARSFAALGDPVRLTIIDLLHDQDLPPHALREAVGVASNLLAHHLRVLEEAGLITRQRSQGDGRRAYVSLRHDAVSALLPKSEPMRVHRVVFVCTENSARSILAEALWRSKSDIPVTSAGTHPGARINPRARTAAARAHVQIVRDVPQPLQGLIAPKDLVISVCDGVNEELDAMTNMRLHWSIPDPARVATDAAFNATVRELNRRIDALLERVVPRSRNAASA